MNFMEPSMIIGLAGAAVLVLWCIMAALVTKQPKTAHIYRRRALDDWRS